MALSQMEDARMARQRHSAEEIVAKLRQVDVLAARGRSAKLLLTDAVGI
jgi:hypothetical protein